MAQINLLKQKSSVQGIWDFLPSILVKILAVLVLAVLAYYGWLIFRVKQAERNILSTQNAITEAKNTVANLKDRDQVWTRQAQIKALSGVISQHLYWSQLLPVLARVTLKKAVYSSLKATTDGNISLSVTVPDLTELDKFLQVFDVPEVNKNFSDVRIGSFHQDQDKNAVTVKFEVRMKYNPDILQYQPNAGN